VGCHQLLRDGAGLVQNARDVLAVLGSVQEVLDDPLRPPARLGLRSQGGRDGLLAHLSDTLPISAAGLARKLGLGFAEALARLTRLELEGSVERRGEGYIRRLRRE
jgi:DNA processing protein